MTDKKEQVLVILTSLNESNPQVYWDEFLELVKAADMEVTQQVTQNMKVISNATYIGSGKVEAIKELLEEDEIDLIVIDHVLSPLQSRNLEKALQKPIMDRNALILEIFETRATTAEAKLQIEAAQLQALLPKLVGSTSYLGRQSGGRNKGAGEKKLELDKRVIKRRIAEVRKELKQLEKQREIRTRKRQNLSIPIVALIGYTNAGKSTIMNQLLSFSKQKETKQVLQKDMLFATLDTSVRRIQVDEHRAFLLIDTVGFVSHLPHELIEAFHSTLEQIKEADLLLQVIDDSSPYAYEQMQVTKDTLTQLEVEDTAMLKVFNKADVMNRPHPITLQEHQIAISAHEANDIHFLVDEILKCLYPMYEQWILKVPYESYQELRKQGVVRNTTYEADGVIVEVDMDKRRIAPWLPYQIQS